MRSQLTYYNKMTTELKMLKEHHKINEIQKNARSEREKGDNNQQKESHFRHDK